MTCFMSCRAVLTVAEGVDPLGVMGLAWPQELPKPRGVDWGVPLGVGPLDPPLPLSGLHNNNTIHMFSHQRAIEAIVPCVIHCQCSNCHCTHGPHLCKSRWGEDGEAKHSRHSRHSR